SPAPRRLRPQLAFPSCPSPGTAFATWFPSEQLRLDGWGIPQRELSRRGLWHLSILHTIPMTKVCTHDRGADLAMRMLEESLRRLRTDHLDLWQVHGVSFDNDPELAYAKGGVLEALDRAKKEGKTRFVGFTGHKSPLVHLEMLRRGYPFDSV